MLSAIIEKYEIKLKNSRTGYCSQYVRWPLMKKLSLLILYNSVIKDDFLLFHLNTDLCLRDLFRKLFMTLLQAEFDEFENC